VPEERGDEERPAEEARAPGAGSAGAALRRARAGEVRGLASALNEDRAGLLEALDRSLEWFGKESSRRYFPVGGVSHSWAWASVRAFRELAGRIGDGAVLEEEVRQQFDFWASPGSDGRGTVLFTGYYSPVFAASLTPDGEYRHPLYRLPADLVKDEQTGEVKGRRVGDRVEPYPTRAEIEISGLLAGQELVWMRDRLEAYLVHIQGSAALRLPDGTLYPVGYDGSNGRDYVSVARLLVADGKLREDELSLPEVLAYLRSHPEDVDRYLRRNPRFVFFRPVEGTEWPAGSLGFKITALRTLATDKKLFPPGSVALVVTVAPGRNGRMERFERLMLDQDAGGAISSPGRADIYFGVGDEAQKRAGGQYAEGRLYYLLLKPERLGAWTGGGE
jgi:membrane-bound lytic murein transglycosylase A